MREYDAQFSDDGQIRWLPYVMYFHPAGYRSPVVNTDSLGFRYSTRSGEQVGVADHLPEGPVDVLAGGSTVFGIGASSDGATLASAMNRHAGGRSGPWLNMGGRSHNSAQELLLHVLHRHRLPRIRRIVLFSGFNDLGLARLPASMRFEGGGFFLSGTFFERLDGRHPRSRLRRGRPRRPSGTAGATSAVAGPGAEQPPDLEQQLTYAADLVLRHLGVWKALAADTGAELTYVLQPLATWVRETGTTEEQALFAHLDRLGSFGDRYGDISAPEAGRRYAEFLGAGCARMGVPFVDFAPLAARALGPDDWMFVDRIHYTDAGYDLAARLLVEHAVR
ncbi:MAG: SGNH/GDSL hydrolase family protein [Acidimicrobiales bacterium]